MRALLANAAWYASALPSRARFLRQARRAGAVQERLLARLVSANAQTEFGRAHGFAQVRSLADYRARVPIRTYEEFAPWLEAAARGRAGVLTHEPVLLFEPTGGSTAGSKLIPYTRSLQAEFQRAIATWVADIFHALPGTLRGTSYWSISPPARSPRRTPGGIPIGFADDVEYLGGRARWVRHAMAVPAGLAANAEPDAFLSATALALLRRADLAIVSVWNPSFLLVLLERIRADLPALLRAIHDGGRALDAEVPPAPDPGRAAALERAFRNPETAFARAWPRLRLLSCWTDAAARPFADRLSRVFPGVRMQGKGLLATEGFVTLPLFGADGCVPAYASHVLEFVDDDGASHGVADLAPGGEYGVVLSTGGGLYRYALGDRVRVNGTYAGLPVLTFLGRTVVSDVVGEKLAVAHAERVVLGALARLGVATRFVLLAPETGDAGAGYVLFLELDANAAPLHDLVGEIERGLADNMQYAHARAIGQLASLRTFVVRRDGLATFLRRSAVDGQSLGDVKPTVLDRRTGWTTWFEGDILPEPSTLLTIAPSSSRRPRRQTT